jgi:hypothetical protein
MIEDNDIRTDSLTKTANVKAFVMTTDSLEFKGVITSKDFGLA